MSEKKGTPRNIQRPSSKPKLAELLKKQPDWVQKELNDIQKYEPDILKALEDQKNKELFLGDPVAFLRKCKIPISGALKQLIRGDASANELSRPFEFRLPNGQVIKPRIKVNFTKGGV